MKNRTIVILLLVALLSTFIPKTSFYVSAEETEEHESTRNTSSIAVGDYITLGQYYGEPIIWRCVDIDENGPLMLSDKVLCFKAYDAAGENDTYHGDGWGYVRKQNGSNCWYDSNLRQWLNSTESVVNYTHCPPTSNAVTCNPYASESGFLSSFTETEINMIKESTNLVTVNEWETHRTGYCDGGTAELIHWEPSLTYVDYSKYFHQMVTDRIFLLTASQADRVYQNLGKDYLIAPYPTVAAVEHNSQSSSPDTPCNTFTNVAGNDGASYERVMTLTPSSGMQANKAYDGSVGIRPAFYLNGGTSNDPYNPTEKVSCLADAECVDEGHYTGNQGDARVYRLDGQPFNGYSPTGYNGSTKRNGNVGLDGTVYENGFEVWIARWNFGDNISWAYRTFKLGGNYHTLTGSSGIIKSYNTTNYDVTAYFYDGDNLLYSFQMTPTNNQFDFSIDVSGVDELKVLVQDNIKTSGGTSYALYNLWLDGSAVTECTGYHEWLIDNENVDFVCAKCGKRQEVSPVLGYEFGKDSFSFSNADVSSYDISYTGFSYMTPSLKLDVMSLLANGMSRFVNYITSGSAYNGACFGIAAMNASFFSGMSPYDFGASNPSALCISHANSIVPNLDTKLKDAINIMFLSQSSTGVAFFQQIQDGSMFGDNNFKDIVTIAKNLKPGDYPVIVAFNIPIGGHAVNIIGIEPDDFMEDDYCITTYDSNRPNFPSYFLVSKDYSRVRFCSYNSESGVKAYNVNSISYFIKSPNYSIDYFAPGLRTSPLYSSTRSAPATKGTTSNGEFQKAENMYSSEDVISFIIPNECKTEITTPSGKKAEFSSSILTSDVPTAMAIPFAGTTLNKIILPYEQGTYKVFIDQTCYININHCENAVTLYAESGCYITYSADGSLTYKPTEENKHIEAAYYKYGILDGSDIIGFELNGNVSEIVSLNCQNGNIELSGADISNQILSVQHNDDTLTNETLHESIEDGVDTVIVQFSENEVEIVMGAPSFIPCNGGNDCPGNKFTDMPAKGNWAHDPIDWAVVHGVTAGTSATTFSPNAGCTRAQVVTFLWRAAGSPEPTATSNPFKDVAAGAWYYKAVLWASETGVTAGTSATTFSPNQTCTRGQIVTFIWRYEGSPEATTTSNPFTDVPDGTWYTKAVLWASETGVTAGTSASTFSPNATCTRAQVVTFLYRDMEE